MKKFHLGVVLAAIGIIAFTITQASSEHIKATKASNTQKNYIPASYQFKVKREWLTMKDGVRLSATIYEPIAKVANERFPIVFEVLPYRKDDSFASRDYPVYSYFAKR